MAEPPLVLGVDTATTVAVGLARGPHVLHVAGVQDRMAHVEQLTPLVHQCLQAAGLRPGALTQVVVGLGPGPFTGLRVGIVTAQVLAFALLIGAIAIPGAFLAKAFVERMPVHIHTAILDAAVMVGGIVMITAALRH